MTKLSGSPSRVFTTILLWKHFKRTRLIVVPNGKKVKNWVIRSQAPKLVMIEHGEGSTSRRLWVSNEGLINLMRLKVYSDLTRNGKETVDKAVQC
jgi:hypothetical protein